MKKASLVLLIALAILSLGFYFVTFSSTDEQEDTSSSSSTQQQTNADDEDDFPSEVGPKLIIGNGEADVFIIEFIDYKCPNCNTFHNTTKREIEQEYGGRVAFEIHQTPFIGPDSGRAARGAYCSHIYGDVFEEYNDTVFGYMFDNYYSQNNLSAEFEDILTAEVLGALYTESGGKDLDSFLECTADQEKINLYINADQLLAAEKEVRGTPSFAVGDTSLIGPQQFSVFKALIEAELR